MTHITYILYKVYMILEHWSSRESFNIEQVTMEDPCENFNNRPPIAAQETNQVPYKIFSFHNLLVTLKLDYWNFVVWKHQILNFFKKPWIR